MSEPSTSTIYQLKVVLLGVSPMIWRRLLVSSDCTITDLHYILQIAMGWSDDHLNRFRIHGIQYGVYHPGGIWFSHDPDTVRLKDLGLRINERFVYEYDFTDEGGIKFGSKTSWPMILARIILCVSEVTGHAHLRTVAVR